MSNVCEIIGIVKGFSKKGIAYTILHVISDFEEWEYKNNVIGKKVNNYYISKDLNVSVGNCVELVYGVGFGGKAIVIDVNIL